jgi:hypothetical protein
VVVMKLTVIKCGHYKLDPPADQENPGNPNCIILNVTKEVKNQGSLTHN